MKRNAAIVSSKALKSNGCQAHAGKTIVLFADHTVLLLYPKSYFITRNSLLYEKKKKKNVPQYLQEVIQQHIENPNLITYHQ